MKLLIDVIVDTDPGLGVPNGDVDDGLAIFSMLNSKEFFNIKGFTTCHGNVPVDIGYKLIKKYLRLAKNTPIPVIKGAKSKNMLGKANEASDFIINQVKEHPKEITIFALAPLTNIATAILKNPEIVDDIKELTIMGGLIGAPITKFSPFLKFIDERFYDKISINFLVAEFNVVNDPKSAYIVLNQPIKTNIIPLNVTTKLVITKKDLLTIRENNSIISNYCYRNLIFWNAINSLITGGGFFPHDILVPMFKIQPELFKFKKLALKVDIKNIPGKISIIKDNIKARNIKMVCYDISKQLLIKKFLEILNR